MSKLSYMLLTALFLINAAALSQVAQGPFPGSIAGGVVVTTNNFGADAPVIDPGEFAPNRFIVPPTPPPPDMPAPTGPEGSNYFEDPGVREQGDGPPPITLGSYAGLGQAQGAGFPPDPYIAVGPNHLIQVINTTFRITTKSGTTLKTISYPAWFATTISGVGYSDPKVQYDHFAGRWIMTILTFNTSTQVAYDMVSVSDDNDPIGTWYNWAIPSHLNGSTNTGTFGDYPGLGFDNQAIYITSNHFTFPGSYSFAKIRIIGKAQLYANTAGAVSWSDFSNVIHPSGGSSAIGIRPAVIHGLPNEYYLVGIPNFTSGTSVSLYRITNPLTTPAVTGVTVSVSAWSAPPQTVNQLGGGSPGIDGGGSNGFIRSEPTYRDSSIWIVHSANNGGYTAIRYARISTLTNTAVEDVSFGAFGYYYIYPAIKVDKDKNLVVTATRTGDTEYASAAFTWRLTSDLPGLRASTVFAPGLGNYVVTGGGSRNRWGDYMGIAIDPSDQNNFWMLTEYAAATNTFGNWVHGVRLVPFQGSRIFVDRTSIDFGLVEVGRTSDTAAVTLFNIGSSTLTVSSITRTQSQYSLLNLPSFPVNLNAFDSLRFRVVFTPTAHASIADSLTIVSNDGTNPTTKIPLNAKGIIIGRAQVARIYSTSAATAPPAQLYYLNPNTGAPTAIGPNGVTEIHTLTIRPTTQELYGTYASATNTTVYRMSRDFGDALAVRTFNIPNMRAIAFNQGDSLYGGTTGGRLYRLNLVTGDTTYLGTSPGIFYSGLAFNPITRKLYASTRPPLTGRDNMYTVNIANGDTAFLGAAGFTGRIIPGITFNAVGALYGITGSGSQTIEFVRLDTANGAGTLIGSTGMTGLHSLALRTDSLSVGVDDIISGIPSSYTLDQNYPNPFNPTTQIRYGLPERSSVTVGIYNVLGQEIVRLHEGEQEAGYHLATWSGTGTHGTRIASGVYFYKLTAQGSEGRSFVQTRKMLLIK